MFFSSFNFLCNNYVDELGKYEIIVELLGHSDHSDLGSVIQLYEPVTNSDYTKYSAHPMVTPHRIPK